MAVHCAVQPPKQYQTRFSPASVCFLPNPHCLNTQTKPRAKVAALIPHVPRWKWGAAADSPHSAAGTQACASKIRTALGLFRSLSKTSSKWKLRGGCSFFLHSTWLTPFFLSSSISQSFYSSTFLPFFYRPRTLGKNHNLKA